MIGMAESVSVVVGDGHVVQAVVLRRRRRGVREAIGLVGEAIGGAETLPGADGARPLVRVFWVRRLPLKAILFGSGEKWRVKETEK